jgi:prophage antirepressor-like protein
MIPQKTRERQIIPLNFQQHTVRTVLIGGDPWFVAKDVCDILEITNARKAIQDFPENERNTVTISYGIQKDFPENEQNTLTTTEGIHEGPGNPNVNIVNEPGLYRLIFQSRKPEAEQFKAWVFASVLPQIRQTGFYFPADSSPDASLLTAAIARYFASRLPNRQAEIETGRLLVLLKESKRHGEFMPCLSAMGVPHRSALRYMKRFRRSEGWELPEQKNAEKQTARLPVVSFSPLSAIRQMLRIRDAVPMSIM